MNRQRQKIIEGLLQTMAKIRGSFHHGHGALLTEFGVGMPHLKMLFCVGRSEDGMAVKELAEWFRITPGAATQFIDRLLNKGLVERFEDRADRRIVRIRLSTKAREHFQRMKQFHREKMMKLFASLSDEELQQLATILQKITLNCAEWCYHWRGGKQTQPKEAT